MLRCRLVVIMLSAAACQVDGLQESETLEAECGCAEGSTCVDGECLTECRSYDDCLYVDQRCVDGLCRFGAEAHCEKGDDSCVCGANADCVSTDCTWGSCVEGRCQFTDRGGACDDGDPCTVDACHDGVCVGEPLVCEQPEAVSSCADTTTLRVVPATGVCDGAGACVHAPEDTDCALLDSECLGNARCDASSGTPTCTGDFINGGMDCTRDTGETGVCFRGGCIACTTASHCNDLDACTLDTCNATSGTCTHTQRC